MIVFLVIAGIALLTTVFIAMPNIPPVPPELIAFQSGFNDILLTAIQFLRYIFSPALIYVALVVITAVFLGEPIYHGIMWILRKIPVLGIK